MSNVFSPASFGLRDSRMLGVMLCDGLAFDDRQISLGDARLRATFGERYALRIESEPGAGTTAIMTVPGLRAEPSERAAPTPVHA